MEEIEPGAPGGLNRRSLIKRAGIVGAGVAAWSTPMVTSLASKAYAVGSPAGGCRSCGLPNDTCAGQVLCGDGGVAGCFCSGKVDGSGCVCAESTFCDNPLCATDADCGPFLVCLSTCCAETRCFIPCDNTQGVAVATGVQPEGRSSAPN